MMNSARLELWAQDAVENIIKKNVCVCLLSWRFGKVGAQDVMEKTVKKKLRSCVTVKLKIRQGRGTDATKRRGFLRESVVEEAHEFAL